MPRFLSVLLGPELYWIIVCGLVHFATRRHLAPDPAVTEWLDRYWGWLPFILTPLTFVCFLLPGTGRWWLLLRIDVAVAVGLFCAALIFANGMTYHKPSSGPGAGTAFMAIPLLGYALAAVGTVIAAVVIWWRSRGTA